MGAHRRVEAAAMNNAEWCAAVWRSFGLPVRRECGLWFCERETPRFYPNVVTVDPSADPKAQTELIARLRRSHPDLDLSIKDSFAALSLDGLGLAPLFDARWLGRPASARPTAKAALQWRQVALASDLADWEVAWRGPEPVGPTLFQPSLLADPNAIILAGADPAGKICAGCIAYDAAGLLGLTNLFGRQGEVLGAIAAHRPGRDLACYETGQDAERAKAAGFEVLGTLRVWVRTGESR